jgi:hypothetical protein
MEPFYTKEDEREIQRKSGRPKKKSKEPIYKRKESKSRKTTYKKKIKKQNKNK